MLVPDRSLTVMLGGEPLSFSGRMRLRGEDTLSLFPALFTLELWDLPEEMYLRVSRCREISVSHEEACLVSGTVSDVFRHPVRDGVVTTVAISLGLDLWESVVSLSVPAGTSLSDTVRRILAASGTGIPLLSFPDPDPVLPRGRSFFGRASECIASALSCHSEQSEESVLRAMLTPSGLMVVPEQGDSLARSANMELPNCSLRSGLSLTEADLTDTVAFVGGSLRGTKRLAVLSAAVSGWRPGQTVAVRQGGVSFRGIIVSRSVDADTAAGAWKCEMILEVV